MALPANISTGRVTGQFIVGVVDGADVDDEPDFIAASGTIAFTASTPYLPNPTASPNPVTMLKTTILAVLDGEGYICTPSPTDPTVAGKRGIRLVATDDPDASVEGWTWKATPQFLNVNGTVIHDAIRTFDFALPSGATVDLTTVVKVPASQGIGTEQAEALAASAQQSAVESAAAAKLSAAEAAAVKDKALANDAGVASFLTAGAKTTVALDAAIDTKVVADGLVAVDENFDFPAPVAARQAATFAPITEDVELDIWPAFDAAGGPDSWDSTTYAGWIAGIDAKLGNAAVKETIGIATDGSAIHAYTAGRSTAPHTLLVGGTHGHEMGAQFAAMRFFTEFATNAHPLMVGLRAKTRITYIPTLSASGFRKTRTNSAGVDINRNWPWNWAYGPSTEKGAAPLDQPEAKALKAVLDNKPIAFLIDCHDSGGSDPEMTYSATSIAVHAQREIFAAAAARWQATNPDAPATATFAGDNDTSATLRNWGGKYLRWDKERVNAASLLLEGRLGIGGSDSTKNITRKGARWYASFIYKAISTWLELGQSDATYVPHTWWATREDTTASQRTTTVQEGGRLIAGQTFRPLKFTYSSSGNGANYIGFPIRHPGRYLVEFNINVELPADSPATRIDARVACDPMKLDGTDLSNGYPQSTAYVELQPGGWGSVSGRVSVSFTKVPDDSFYMVQLLVRVASSGATAILRDSSAALVTVRPMPNFAPARAAVIARP